MKAEFSRRALQVGAILMGSVLTTVASAAIFPDVPLGSPYKEQIEFLVGEQVINGNPDGRFYPERSVNRAEMLKMLYIASGREPDAFYRRCFPDVQPGGWYEPYVCDAANWHFIEGYSDGLFRPEKSVSRVEAIKMIAGVFGLPVEELTDESRSVVKFVDVSLSAWYTKYLYLAFSKGILPIQGQDGPRFLPDQPLLRGEAAAYIFNALHAKDVNMMMNTEQETINEEQNNEETNTTTTTSERSRQLDPNASTPPELQMQEISIPTPTEETGVFDDKRASIFTFDLSRDATVLLRSSVTDGDVSCRLFRLEKTGFSNEFYLGLEEKGACSMRVSLSQGSYQIELRPTVAGTNYSMRIEDAVGDGNDGFREARGLVRTVPRVAVLESNDTFDWYRFVVQQSTKMELHFMTDSNAKCTVYAMADVDLYGFNNPECNAPYTYPTGTYYIGVGRATAGSSNQGYTLQLE